MGRGQSVAINLPEPFLVSPVASTFVLGRHPGTCGMLRLHEQPDGKKMGERVFYDDPCRETAEVPSKIDKVSGG